MKKYAASAKARCMSYASPFLTEYYLKRKSYLLLIAYESSVCWGGQGFNLQSFCAPVAEASSKTQICYFSLQVTYVCVS